MKYVVLALTALVMAACAYQPTHSPKAANDALTPDTPKQAKSASQQGIPSDVQAFLQGSTTVDNSAAALLDEPRFVLQAKQVDAQEFFHSLGVDSPYNIVVHPNVSGKISVNLKDVTVDETLDVIADMYGYEVRRDNRMIQIYPAGVRTQTFQLDYLSLRRFGLSQTEISSGGVSQERDNGSGLGNSNSNSGNQNSAAGLSPLGGNNNQQQSSQFGQNQMQGNGSSVITQSQTALWDDLEEMLQGVVGSDGSIVLSPQAGLVSVTAPPNRLRAVGDFI
ncbi:MAG: MSHA biogenesis protein MshL, partial [Idiomarina sp.]